jgi:NADH:ubiquinone oxidoreductase subunit H
MVSVLIFFSFGLVVVNVCVGVFCALCFIWFRRTFPRFRYDLLMEWCWVYCLVFVFFFFFLLFGFCIFL